MNRQELINVMITLVSGYEGFREFAYPDPLSKLAKACRGKDFPWGFVKASDLLVKTNFKASDGKPWTVGYGFTARVNENSVTTKSESDIRLRNELLKVCSELDQNIVRWTIQPDPVQIALVDLCYNMGITTLLTFKNTLSKMYARDYKGMAQGIENSLYYRQTGQRAKDNVKRILSVL